MASLDSSNINVEKTGETGKDDKGEYYIERVFGEKHCNCHPETCCHFDGLTDVDYERKVYLTKTD